MRRLTQRVDTRGRRGAGRAVQAALLVLALLAGLLAVGGPAQAATYPSPPPDFAHPGSPHAPLFSLVGGTTDRPMLAIRVNFSDVAPHPSMDAAGVARRFFGPFPSVAGYFADDSLGALLLSPAPESDASDNGTVDDGVVSVTLPMTRATWRGMNEKSKRTLLLQAIDANVDFAAFDANSDGMVTNAEIVLNLIEADEDPPGFVNNPPPPENTPAGPGVFGCGATRGVDPVTLDGKSLGGGLSIAASDSDTNLPR